MKVSGAQGIASSLQRWYTEAGTQMVPADGTLVASLEGRSGLSSFNMESYDMGNDTAGPMVRIGRGTYSAGKGPASGTLAFIMTNGTARYLHVSADGLLRIHTAPPTGSANTPTVDDTDGTVVGDEISSIAEKNVKGQFTDNAKALDVILNTPVHLFTYKSEAYNNQEFAGIITDESPIFGKDKAAGHPGGKSLNVITLHGYEIAAIKALQAEIVALQEEIKKLKSGK
jgi:hypothetical protein